MLSFFRWSTRVIVFKKKNIFIVHNSKDEHMHRSRLDKQVGAKLKIEQLEDRTVLAGFVVTGTPSIVEDPLGQYETTHYYQDHYYPGYDRLLLQVVYNTSSTTSGNASLNVSGDFDVAIVATEPGEEVGTPVKVNLRTSGPSSWSWFRTNSGIPLSEARYSHTASFNSGGGSIALNSISIVNSNVNRSGQPQDFTTFIGSRFSLSFNFNAAAINYPASVYGPFNIEVLFSVEPTPVIKPDISITSLTLNAVQDSADFAYSTTGNPGPFDVGLYRSTDGITYNAADLIDTQNITPSPTNPQTPGTFTLPSPFVADPNKPYLMVVADPDNTITELDETNNLASFQMVDVKVLTAKLRSAQQANIVDFTYQTIGDTGPFQVRIYRSANPVFDQSDLPIGNAITITPTISGGPFNGSITLASEIPIDPVNKYILVVADPDNLIAEFDEFNNDDGQFRKLVLGVVTHGLSPDGFMPTWVNSVADRLEVQGYDETIRFDWAYNSRRPIRNQAVNAGLSLANDVRSTASQILNVPDSKPNDVIDLHIIGHSRGAVVISQALIDLQQVNGPEGLAMGYYKMTMLDPHPARNSVLGPQGIALGLAQAINSTGANTIGSFSLDTGIGFGGRLLRASVVLSFQAAAEDPRVVIPPNVDVSQSYYQRKRSVDTSGLDRAAGLNLWGELPSAIDNKSQGQFFNADVSLFVTGHSGVPEWYLTLL